MIGEYRTTDAKGGYNGFVAHYIPKDPLIVSTSRTLPHTTPAINATLTKSRLLFRTARQSERLQIAIYTANGRMIANTSQGSIRRHGDSYEWDFSHAGRGVYFYTISALPGVRVVSGSVVAGQ